MKFQSYNDAIYNLSTPSLSTSRKMAKAGLITAHQRFKYFVKSLDNPNGAFTLFRMIDEQVWINNGLKTILIDDNDIELIQGSDLTSNLFSVDAPFDSFQLALQSDTKSNIRSCLVLYRTYDFTRNKSIQNFMSDNDIKTPLEINPNSVNFGEKLITIMFNSNDTILSLIVPAKHIQYISESRSYNEYKQTIDGIKEKGTGDIFIANGFDLSTDESMIQFNIVKLVVSLLELFNTGTLEFVKPDLKFKLASKRPSGSFSVLKPKFS